MNPKNKTWTKASTTIEASIILPMICFLIVFLFYLCFYLYNRAELSKDAYACALRGAQKETLENKEIYKHTKEQSIDLLRERELNIASYKEKISVDKNMVTVTYNMVQKVPFAGSIGLLTGQEAWNFTVAKSAKRLHPVSFIRSCKKIKNLWDENKGREKEDESDL